MINLKLAESKQNMSETKKENLVNVSDYFKILRDNHGLKINICPRQTGVTYDIIDKEQFIIVRDIKTKEILNKKYSEKIKNKYLFTTKEIENFNMLSLLLNKGVDLNKFSSQINTLNIDNCDLFFNEDGDRIQISSIIYNLFYVFYPYQIYNILYVKYNTLELFKLFGKINLWYTCNKVKGE